MDRILDWMRYYNVEITWFLIGYLTFAGLDDLIHGRLLGALLNLGIAFFNFMLYKRSN